MEFRRLGRSGPRVSEVGLGTWQFGGAWGRLDYETAREVVRAAHEAGVNFFDTAQVYGRGRSEEFLGRAIAELGIRDEVVVATKVPGEWLRYRDVKRALEGSLRRLGLDAVDLYQVHWPACWENIPVSETMRAMEDLVREGLVRHIGLSNFPVCLMEEAQASLRREEIVSNQLQYSLLVRDVEKELLPRMRELGMTLIAWSPLAKGALTGKYTPENLPEFKDVREGDPLFLRENFLRIWELVKALREIGARRGKTPAQVALRWLLEDPLVVVIPGARRPEQARENAGASGWRLRKEEWELLDRLSRAVEIEWVTY